MSRELVTVIAAGQEYTGWKSVEITYGLNRAARAFSLRVSEGFSEADIWTFKPGTAVEIYAAAAGRDGRQGTRDLLVTGFVDDYAPSYEASRHEVTVSGRSKSADYVDSAAEASAEGCFENKTPEEIAKDLDRFGIGIGAKVPGDPIPYHQLVPGETAFRAAERVCREQGICMMGLADGSIELTNASKATRQPGSLRLGQNILRANGHISHAKRFSKHAVKGQGRTGHDEALRVEAVAEDAAVKRYRPRVVIAETETDTARASERALTEAQHLAGVSTRATITVQSFRDDTGALWEPNRLVFVDCPWLKIRGDMLIETVRLSQDDQSGSVALLSLVDPRAYRGKKPKHSESDDVWTDMPE